MIGNKMGQAFLGEQGVKLVIAVVSLIILIGIVVAGINGVTFNNEKKQAVATLEKLSEAIKSNDVDFVIYNPDSGIFRTWFIISWPYGDEMPLECSAKGWENCICAVSENALFNLEYGRLNFDKNLEKIKEGSIGCVEISKPVSFDEMFFSDEEQLFIDKVPFNLKIEDKGVYIGVVENEV